MRQSAVLLFALVCCACTRTVYLPKESTTSRTDTLRETVLRLDSVYLHDSIYVQEKQHGDTVYLTTVKTLFRDRWRLRTDTVYQTRSDTVRVKETVKGETSEGRLTLSGVLILVIVIGPWIVAAVYFARD